MNRTLLTAGFVALVVGLTACQSDDGSIGGGDATPNSSQSGPPREHTDPNSPLETVFTVPEGFEAVEVDGFPYPYTDNLSVQAVKLSEGGDDDLIYVTSYVLPEEAPQAYEEQLVLVHEYDDAIGNETPRTARSLALVNGYRGVFRRSELDADGQAVVQRNTFVFSGAFMVQITCQVATPDLAGVMDEGCHQLQTSLLLPEH